MGSRLYGHSLIRLTELANYHIYVTSAVRARITKESVFFFRDNKNRGIHFFAPKSLYESSSIYIN